MPAIFVDACFWIALLHRRDALHDTARQLRRRFRRRKKVTTEMVLVEVLDFFAGFGEAQRRDALDLIQTIVDDDDTDIRPQTTNQFWDAVAFYAARPDQEWGLVDCSSFQMMASLGIREVLTNDHHFTQAGFTILMQ